MSRSYIPSSDLFRMMASTDNSFFKCRLCRTRSNISKANRENNLVIRTSASEVSSEREERESKASYVAFFLLPGNQDDFSSASLLSLSTSPLISHSSFTFDDPDGGGMRAWDPFRCSIFRQYCNTSSLPSHTLTSSRQKAKQACSGAVAYVDFPRSLEELDSTWPLRIEGEAVYPVALDWATERLRRVVTESSSERYSCRSADRVHARQRPISAVALLHHLPRNCTMDMHIEGVTLRTDGGVSGVSTAADPSC
jgi:hypothetical protein